MTKTKKRILKISALLLALVLIGGVAWFASTLVGNPVSSVLARINAKRYIEQIYPDSDYAVDYRGYDFKFCDYYAYVSSPTKLDEHFGIYMNGWGQVIRDGYDSVESKWNVASRLGSEYRTRVNSLFDSPLFPYEAEISYGDLEFDYEPGTTLYPEALTRAELENNRVYDIAALGRTNGRIVLYVTDTAHATQDAAEILLSVRAYFDAAGLPFHRISLVIRSERDAEGNREEGLRLDNFLYADIHEEDLAARIEAHIAAQNEEKE